MARASEMREQLFSCEWAAGFVALWNAGSTTTGKRLSGSAPTAFRLLGTCTHEMVVCWDALGAVACADGVAAQRFSSDEAGWTRLMSGILSPVAAVMGGTIRYEGDLAFLARSAKAFNEIVRVASKVTLPHGDRNDHDDPKH